jgi:hypothetical protein
VSYVPPPPTRLASWPPASVPDRDWAELTPTGYPLCWLDEHAREYVLIRPLFVSIPARAIDPDSTAASFSVPRGVCCSALLADWELRSEFLRVHLRSLQPERGDSWADWLRAQDALRAGY